MNRGLSLESSSAANRSPYKGEGMLAKLIRRNKAWSPPHLAHYDTCLFSSQRLSPFVREMRRRGVRCPQFGALYGTEQGERRQALVGGSGYFLFRDVQFAVPEDRPVDRRHVSYSLHPFVVSHMRPACSGPHHICTTRWIDRNDGCIQSRRSYLLPVTRETPRA